jgi:hypothetical protein
MNRDTTSISVVTRTMRAARGPTGLAFRRARFAVLERHARLANLTYDRWGDDSGGAMRLEARTAREKGALARFLVPADLNHLAPYLAVRADRTEEREMILSLPAGVFEPDAL